MKAALRDCAFYACPAGHGSESAKSFKAPKYHALVERPDNKWGADFGPACGYPFYTEGTEQDARGTRLSQRCGRPGCRAAFAKADAAPVTLSTVKPPTDLRTKVPGVAEIREDV